MNFNRVFKLMIQIEMLRGTQVINRDYVRNSSTKENEFILHYETQLKQRLDYLNISGKSAKDTRTREELACASAYLSDIADAMLNLLSELNKLIDEGVK